MAAGLTLRAEQMAGFEAYLTQELGALALDGPRDLWLMPLCPGGGQYRPA